MVALPYACCTSHSHFNVLVLLQINLFSAGHLSLAFMISSYIFIRCSFKSSIAKHNFKLLFKIHIPVLQ